MATAAKRNQKDEKQLTFTWQGKDKSGNISKGKIDAVDLASAKIASTPGNQPPPHQA